MKYIFLLFLAGCFIPYPESAPANYPSEIRSSTPIQRSSGISSNNVQWSCTQEDITEASVWISCAFENHGNQQVKTCIDVSYTHDCTEENPSGFVANPKRVCTGNLNPGDSYEGYASYFNFETNGSAGTHYSAGFTNLVHVCGNNLLNCKMGTSEVDGSIR